VVLLATLSASSRTKHLLAVAAELGGPASCSTQHTLPSWFWPQAEPEQLLARAGPVMTGTTAACTYTRSAKAVDAVNAMCCLDSSLLTITAGA
jgi:hypothetical protein